MRMGSGTNMKCAWCRWCSPTMCACWGTRIGTGWRWSRARAMMRKATPTAGGWSSRLCWWKWRWRS